MTLQSLLLLRRLNEKHEPALAPSDVDEGGLEAPATVASNTVKEKRETEPEAETAASLPPNYAYFDGGKRWCVSPRFFFSQHTAVAPISYCDDMDLETDAIDSSITTTFHPASAMSLIGPAIVVYQLLLPLARPTLHFDPSLHPKFYPARRMREDWRSLIGNGIQLYRKCLGLSSLATWLFAHS